MVSPVELPNTYTAALGVVNVTAAAEIVVLIAQLKALIPDPTAGVSASHPDFDLIQPATAINLRAEIDAFAAAIAAAPTV